MRNVEFYRPKPSDAEALFQLERLCFPDPWDIDTIAVLLSREHSIYTLAAFRHEKPIGYISALISPQEVLHITTLCVHPDLRRRGIATELLGAALYWGGCLGAREVRLEVSSENGAASGFYEVSGFKTVKDLPDYYGPGRDAVLMSRSVESFRSFSPAIGFLWEKLGRVPEIGVVLGSGLGWLSDHFGASLTIPFSGIPGMAGQMVEGHGEELRISADGRVAFVMGRRHHYQGYAGKDIVLLPAALAAIGVGTWVLTSSAGAVDREYTVGDVMVFTDHINFSGCVPPSPQRNIGYNVYSASLGKIAAQSMEYVHEGVFACVSGPAYETGAEVDLIRRCGASAVSMSTAQEALALRSIGSRVLALALITNEVKTGDSVNHEEVLSAQQRIREKQERSIIRLIERLLS